MVTSQDRTHAASQTADTVTSLAGTRLAPLADLLSDVKYFDVGDKLFEEGRPRTHLLVLFGGWAYAYRTLSDGRRHVIEIYLPGDLVGVAEAWEGSAGPDVGVLSRACVAPIRRTDAVSFAYRSEQGMDCLFTSLADTAMALSLQSTSLARHTAYERVATLLWSLRARSQPSDQDDILDSFFCPLSQSVMADALGLSTVHVNRSLNQLARDGVLRKTPKQVDVLDDHSLKRIVQV